MILNLRRLLRLWYHIIVFIILIVLLYQLTTWTLHQISPKYQYKRPTGNSVEAIQQEKILQDKFNLREKLYYFWWNGE